MPVSASMFSGRRRLSTVPSGRAANASFVGAVAIFKNRHEMICECIHDLYSFHAHHNIRTKYSERTISRESINKISSSKSGNKG